ncbi:MAG: hypothetical protein AAFO94_17135, partial [Bacteroidota bacterium]
MLLSVTTLKRVWGKVNYQSSPSITTLDALARFIGHQNWVAFQNHSTIRLHDTNVTANISTSTNWNKWLARAAITLVVIVGCLGLFSLRQDVETFSTENVAFDFKPIATGIPNTVIFSYHASTIAADSFFIQQSWDDRLRHRIDPMNDFHAVTYYYPGLFKAKLIANESILLEKDLLIPSEGWLGTIRKQKVPYYLRDEQIMKEGMLSVEPATILGKGFDPNQEMPVTNLYLVGEFGAVTANDFQLTTRFKNLRTGNDDICQHTHVVLYTTAGAMVIPFAIKGCAAELDLILPHRYLNGQRHDLTAFGVDFADWVQLDVAMQQQRLTLTVNGQIVYQEEVYMDYGL